MATPFAVVRLLLFGRETVTIRIALAAKPSVRDSQSGTSYDVFWWGCHGICHGSSSGLGGYAPVRHISHRNEALMTGCGILTKGFDPKDDLVPCGTRLWFGKDTKTRREGILLCQECQRKLLTKSEYLVRTILV